MNQLINQLSTSGHGESKCRSPMQLTFHNVLLTPTLRICAVNNAIHHPRKRIVQGYRMHLVRFAVQDAILKVESYE